MGGAFSESGEDRTLTGFSDVGADGAERLVVAVLWRHPRPASPPRAPGAVVLGLLRTIGSLLRRRAAVQRRTPSWQPPPGWSGACTGDGARAVLYHREQRLVRVLGAEYPLPAAGETLVLLVDE